MQRPAGRAGDGEELLTQRRRIISLVYCKDSTEA